MYIPFLLLSLLVVGCSDLSMISSAGENTAAVEVRSLHDGGVIGPGEGLSFVVHGPAGSTGDVQLEIVLTDSRGNSVWSRTIDDPAMNEELELLLPELGTGQYEVVFRVGGSSAEEERLTFFYVLGRYAVAGLSSYPPSTVPGAEISVRADLVVPPGSDPYLRWTQGGTLLARGRLGEGLDRIIWKAPPEQGVYPVTVELFPVAPPGNDDFRFASPLTVTARLYIATDSPASADSLLPESSYYSLFHFDGSLQDRGSRAAAAKELPTAVPFGGAAHSADGPAAGYRLGRGAGIRYPHVILPGGTGDAREGSASAPWTLTFALVPEEEPRDVALLSVRSADAVALLSVGFDAAGSLAATLHTPSGNLALPSGIAALALGRLQRVDLSLIASADTITALWFLDGVQTAVVALAGLVPRFPEAGETVLGGERGFVGIIAELGVYFRDELGRPAVDPGIYRTAMQTRFGKDLILAEGFEGLFAPAGFHTEGTGAPRRGALALTANSTRGARIETPLFDPALPASLIEITTVSGFPAGSRIALRWENEAESFATIQAGPAQGAANDPKRTITIDNPPISLVLRLTSKELAVMFGDSGDRQKAPSLAVAASDEGNRWLTLSVLAPASARPDTLEIDSILIRRASER